MISSRLGCNILDGFLRNLKEGAAFNLNVSKLYLGLLVGRGELPKEEQGSFAEPQYKDYQRILLTDGAGNSLMSEAVTNKITDSKGKDLYITSVTNKATIMFPEVFFYDGETEQKFDINGFGIFEKQKTGGGVAELPIIWGGIKNVVYVEGAEGGKGEYTVGDDTLIELTSGDVPVIPENFITISIS